MARLKKQGFWQNTVILFGSDHGLLMGEYGMGGKALLHDLAAKIPCFIHDPALPAQLHGRYNLSSSASVQSFQRMLN